MYISQLKPWVHPVAEMGPLHSPADDEEIAWLAYASWQARGCPDGSPEEAWFRAEEELKGRGNAAAKYRPFHSRCPALGLARISHSMRPG